MKINYFFPFFKEDDAGKCLESFTKSNFYNENKNDACFIFVCKKDDDNNKNFLSNFVTENDKLLFLDKDFTYNDAFYYSVKYFDADIVLLADAKIKKLDVVFSKSLEKYNKGASIVHFVKRPSKFKGFFIKIFHYLYNMMIKIFTGKKDRLNVISLGLIDKDVIDLLKEIPNKCCFLKNTKELYGFKSRSIYIDDKTKTYKLKFSKLTTFLKTVLWFLGISAGLIIIQILLNIFIKPNLDVYNIINVLVVTVLVLSSLIALPKHFFDIRNRENVYENLKLTEYKKPQPKIKKEDKDSKTNEKKETKKEVKTKEKTVKKSPTKKAKTTIKKTTTSKTKKDNTSNKKSTKVKQQKGE